MIEFCTVKRMIILVTVLIIRSFQVRYWTPTTFDHVAKWTSSRQMPSSSKVGAQCLRLEAVEYTTPAIDPKRAARRLCVIFLGVENALTEDAHTSPLDATNLTGKESCWKVENFSIKVECQKCTNFEMVSGHLPVCLLTGFKELVSCKQSGDIYRTCPRLPWIEKRNFWLFEAAAFVTGIFSWSAVFLRQKQLDHRTLQRIQKQIAAGV